MSAKKHGEMEDRALRSKGRAVLVDFVDTDRYNSSKKREAIPYERQRELGISKPVQPKGPVVSIDEAWERRSGRKSPRRK